MKDASWGVIIGLVGFLTFIFVLFKQQLFNGVAALGAPTEPTGAASNSIDQIGHFMLSSGENGYLCRLRPSASCCWPAS